MSRLVLINGAPGSGKSTLAAMLAQDGPLTLALDVDALKHALGGWRDDPLASGLHARRLTTALAREQLAAEHDVVIGQYLARTAFIEELEALAREASAQFVEVVLDLPAPALAHRLAARAAAPSRPEHLVNDSLVGPEDAQQLVESLQALHVARPHAAWVDAQGSPAETLDRVRAVVHAPEGCQ